MLVQPNIILIVCDTLRKDVLGLYGGEAKTPSINRLARDSVVYDNCVAPSPWTFPSHVSLFTGMYPSEHGIHETRTRKEEALMGMNDRLAAERLSDYLLDRGYKTIGISNNINVSRFTGFDRGFGSFFNVETTPWKSKVALEARMLGANSMQVATELIKRGRSGELYKFARELMRISSYSKAVNYPKNKGVELTNSIVFNTKLGSPFFLFINLMEMHEPYEGYSETETQDNLTGVKPISKKRAGYMKQKYVEECEFLDRGIGEFIDMLKLRGLYDNSLIILTSDHGQAFNEHGHMYHGIYVYDEIARIPLVVKYPRGRKFRKRSGYQNLVYVPALIKSIIGGGDDAMLTRRVTFCEAFGNTAMPPESYRHRLKYMEKRYERLRTAVYADGYKLSINGSDGVVEEFLEGSRTVTVDTPARRKAFGKLAAELRRFKSREEGFRIPEG